MHKTTNTRPGILRTGLLTAALAGGAIIGVSQIGGVVNAQTDDTEVPSEQPTDDQTDVPSTDAPDTTTDDSTTDDGADRSERREAERAAGDAREQELADLLGIDAEALHEQLRDGATLAELAEENGVAVDSVIGLLVEQTNERIDAAVEEGHLDADEADEKRAVLEEQITTRVNEGGGDRAGGGRGDRGGRGHRGGDCDGAADGAETDAPDDAEAAETSLELMPTGAADVVEA